MLPGVVLLGVGPGLAQVGEGGRHPDGGELEVVHRLDAGLEGAHRGLLQLIEARGDQGVDPQLAHQGPGELIRRGRPRLAALGGRVPDILEAPA